MMRVDVSLVCRWVIFYFFGFGLFWCGFCVVGLCLCRDGVWWNYELIVVLRFLDEVCFPLYVICVFVFWCVSVGYA